jgi:hypothetical protein
LGSDNDSKESIEAFIFEYALFLLTSARGTADEPHLYGALRLIDGISRLTELYSRTTSEIKPDKFLLEVNGEIQAKLTHAMKSDDSFIQFMDGLIVKFTDEMMKRYSQPPVNRPVRQEGNQNNKRPFL